MAAANTDKFIKLARKWTGQIGSGGVADESTTTIPLASSTNLPTDTAVIATIDRVDADGNETPTKEETVLGVVSGNNLINCIRGVEGTAQAHSAGATVEILVTAYGWNRLIDGILVDHNQDGTHKHTVVYDANDNEVQEYGSTASAVNYVKTTNAATGNAPKIEATGDDTNIDLELTGKGTGKVKVDTKYGDINTATDGTTITFDLSLSNIHTVTLGGNRTLAVSNESVGQVFIIRLKQDATGSRTVTWWSGINWAGGSAPTLTTTANKTDVFGFIVTASGTYDGFVVGQNI